MKLDSTTLRLIRAASQAVADECSAILSEPPDITLLRSTPEMDEAIRAAVGTASPVAPTPSKRTRGKAAAPAEPVVVTDTPPVTNVEQPAAPAAPAPAAPAPAPAAPAPAPAAPAPAPAAPAPAAPAPATTLPPQSTVTDQELAGVADVLKNDPEKLRLYQAWRDSSEFLQPDGTLASGKGLPLSKIPNVGDNRDRLFEALKRALV